MARATHAEVITVIGEAITNAEADAVAHEIKIIEHDCDGMAEYVKVMARVSDEDNVVSDALIEGLKTLSMDASKGIVFNGTKMDWGRDAQDFVLLLFTVDMMKNCGGY